MISQTIAHQRRFGLASHLGVLFDMPSIGVAKSRLVGKGEMPGPKKGNFSNLMDNEELIGAIVRSKDNTKPLYVSIGHKCTLFDAISLVLETSRFRIPEPTRMAHNLCSESKIKFEKEL